MKSLKHITACNKRRYIEIIYLFVLLLLGLSFLCCVHNYYFLFVEQLQIFRFDSLYWDQFYKLPGGIAAYTGYFFTQFFVYNHIGGIIIVMLLAILLIFMYMFMQKSKYNRFNLPLLSIPVILLFYCFFDTNTRTGTIIALIIVFIFLNILTNISKPVLKNTCSIIFIPFIYWFTGAGIFIYTSFLIIGELKKNVCLPVIIRITGYLFLTIIPPFIAQHYLILTDYKAWVGISYYNISLMPLWNYLAIFSPVIIVIVIHFLGLCITSEKSQRIWLLLSLCTSVFIASYSYVKKRNYSQRELYGWDYHLKQENWQQLLLLAKQKKDYNPLFINITNLALAKTGQLTSHLFDFPQRPDAISLWTSNYYPMSISGEIYYQLDMPQIARSFFFMANTQSPNSQSAHLYKRLAEIELITENYQMAQKYISSLANTLFYKKEITEMQKMINQQSLSENLQAREENKPSHPGFFATEFKYNLLIQYNEHPENSFVKDYLLVQCILENDFPTFFKVINKDTSSLKTNKLPTVYQEFILMYAYLINDNSFVDHYGIQQSVVQSFYAYLQTNKKELSTEQMREELKVLYGNTYWYYAQFINRIK